MVKGNYGVSYQQCINEVFASKLHEQQGFQRYTPYYLTNLLVDGNREGLGCLCFNYCNEHLESISAWELLQTVKIRQNESLYYPLKSVCLSLGISEQDFHSFIDYQIMTDYLISNTDRHMNNIAVLRDPDTLEISGFAPVYDSGNSMFYNVPLEQMTRIRLSEIRTHSFIEKECRLLQYVHDRSLVNPEKAEMDFSVYEKDVLERHQRIPALRELYLRKLDNLCAFQSGKDIWKSRHA